MKFLQFLLILYILFRLFRFFLPFLARLLLKKVAKKSEGAPREASCDMIPCTRCGVFVDKNATVSRGSKPYCSDPCRDG